MARSRALVLVNLFIPKSGHLTKHFIGRNIYLTHSFKDFGLWLLPCMVAGLGCTGDFLPCGSQDLESGRDHEQDVPKNTPTQ